MFPLLLIPTIVLPVLAMVYGFVHYRDSLNPLVYLGALLLAMYGLMPLLLLIKDGPDFYVMFFSESDLYFVMMVNLLGVAAMLLGVVKGAGRWRPATADRLLSLMPEDIRRLRFAAKAVGLIGVGIFAYVRPGLGGWSDYGYARDAYLLTVPALLWLMVSFRGTRPQAKDWLMICVIAMPLFLIAIFNARRGPMFMIVVGFVVGWYFMRNRRPSFRTVLVGGILLGTLLLILVTNREAIREKEFFFDKSPLEFTGAASGNEFIFGGGFIINYANSGEYMWGRQYIVDFIIRPIPRQLWPTKYEDAWAFLGIPNAFLGEASDFGEVLGWQGAVGSAPGIVADLWWEFSWLYLVVIWGVGWGFGRSWRKAIGLGGHWIPLYGILTSLSIYLILQNVEAFGFRFLIMATGNWFIWRYGTALYRRNRMYGLSRFPSHPISYQNWRK